MPELALGRDFLPAYARLQPRVQRAVITAIGKFAEHTHAGLHLEKLTGARDPNVRTIRIDKFYRGVVLALGEEKYALIHVLPHDDAIDFAVSRRFTVNQTLGVLEMRDQAGIEEFARTEAADMHGGLFDHVSAADFVRLGIDADLVPLLRVIATDQQLESLTGRLPETQLDTLKGLASGMPVAEVWAELAPRIVSGVDTDDLLTAARRTPERIAFVSGPVELAAILAHPFDVWRTFLHPTQRDVAYRDTYSGPALVTGSAGTGKTVTGLHRAVFLADRLPDGEKVLLTTFTRALAEALSRQLHRLTTDPAVRARIDVISVDKLAYDVVTRHSGKVTIAESEILDQLWEAAARTGPTYVNRAGQVTTVSAAFLRREWEQVILAQRLTTLDEYLAATRKGRGASLRANQRAQVWAAVDSVVRELTRRRLRTHTQLADEAAEILRRSAAVHYRHVVVDEGQDLHPAQWRLLRALVPPGPDDMFLLADPHQRIYDSHVSLAQLGIEVRGRTRRLTVNYRTTHEILDLSVRVLSGDPATGLDGQDDTLRGYRAVTRGGAPDLVAHASRDDEYDALIERVGTWIDQGVEEHAIGVAVRTGQMVRAISRMLSEAHIPVADEKRGVDGVRVDTMHRMKGLEFQCLAVVGLDAGVLPAPNALTSAAEDPHAHRQDLQRERCLLFVALTRARDVLYLSHAGTPSPLLPAARRAPEAAR